MFLDVFFNLDFPFVGVGPSRNHFLGRKIKSVTLCDDLKLFPTISTAFGGASHYLTIFPRICKFWQVFVTVALPLAGMHRCA